MEVTNVLVVDDSSLIVKLIVKLLLLNKIDGYYFEEAHIMTASDGMQAFDMISLHPEISLIISDVTMPTLNGDELVEILLDTGKLSSIEVVLVTEKDTAQKLSQTTKKNILGVIHKPFNKDTFPAAFNALVVGQKERLADLVLIKEENELKYVLAINALKAYLTENNIPCDDTRLNTCLKEQFSYDARVLDEDLLTLLNIVLEEYIALSHLEDEVDQDALRRAFMRELRPQKDFEIVDPFSLRVNFEKVLADVNQRVSGMATLDVQETIPMVFKEIEETMATIFAKVKFAPKMNPQLFDPYFELVITTLSDCDPDFNDYKLQEILAQYEELVSFHKWMRDFYEKTQIYVKIPKLKSSKELMDETNKKLHVIYKYVSASLLHYTGAIEDYIWQRAKKSALIMAFFRRSLPDKVPNTKNLLMHLNKLSKQELKEYELSEHENVAIISNNLDILQEIKNKQEGNFPAWQMFGFSKATLLESWLASNEVHKIILDSDFTTPVFNSGLQYLVYLQKHFPKINDIIKRNKLYILSSKAKLAEINEHRKETNFVLISKPLRDVEVKTTLMYN